jgi:Transposase DDE domain
VVQIQELLDLGQQWGGRLDAQDEGQRQRGRPLSDSGAKARLYHAVKEARLACVIKVDLKGDLFCYTLDEDKLSRLERLDGKLVVVTNTDAPAAEVVLRYKSLADIERGFRALKSDIDIGPRHHRLPKRIRAHALICFLAPILHWVLRMRLRDANRQESPTRLLEALKQQELHLRISQARTTQLPLQEHRRGPCFHPPVWQDRQCHPRPFQGTTRRSTKRTR